MHQFKKKHPVDYMYPYQNMYADVLNAIAEFEKTHSLSANYVLVNIDDHMHLALSAQENKAFPKNRLDLHVIKSARIVRSPDIPKGSFEVVIN